MSISKLAFSSQESTHIFPGVKYLLNILQSFKHTVYNNALLLLLSLFSYLYLNPEHESIHNLLE